ncbi:MAG: ribonuclease III [Ignavibacteriae bacterium HGW-Ignavibacteriae-3]|nr:MAG: ribonuclease III [Ignavibacteriae bacterium HGW-Ignavibacteriae-3]
MFRTIFNRLNYLFSRNLSSDKEFRKVLSRNLRILQSSLNISIKNPTFYITALTHSSFLDLHPELPESNERLEYLGDSVLSMVTGNYLFAKYPNEEEGFLTKSRSLLVNRERLAVAAEGIGLQNIILYNQKYLRDSLEGMQTILSDALEAVIGAIYLDQGLKVVEKVIVNCLIKPLEYDDSFLTDTNYKGQLLELAHYRKLSPPRYLIKEEDGPPHNKKFTIEVFVGEDLMGVGMGKNKKSAEQEASRLALEKFNARN